MADHVRRSSVANADSSSQPKDSVVIVRDDDRKKPIHIRQSIFCFLAGVCAMEIVVMIVMSATASDINGIDGRASVLHLIGPIIARPIAFLILVVIMAGPPAWLIRRGCCWRVYVSDGVLTDRSLFRSRSVRTADIKRVVGSRGRADLYPSFLGDGTSIAMHDVAGDSLRDLARFEDEIIYKGPRIEMNKRLFSEIIKYG